MKRSLVANAASVQLHYVFEGILREGGRGLSFLQHARMNAMEAAFCGCYNAG